GKIAKDILGSFQTGEPFATADQTMPLIIGFIAAFITGLVACTWMIKLVKKSKLSYFSYYCFAVAALVIIEANFHFLRQPFAAAAG
ncbi:MAG: undecaprenyl-diphosphatase, partial [Mariniblastus sp.]